jgi:hypothetical protein
MSTPKLFGTTVAVLAMLTLAACGGGGTKTVATPKTTAPTSTTADPARALMNAWITKFDVSNEVNHIGPSMQNVVALPIGDQLAFTAGCYTLGLKATTLDIALPSPNAELNTALAAADKHLKAASDACVTGAENRHAASFDIARAEFEAAVPYYAQAQAILRRYP